MGGVEVLERDLSWTVRLASRFIIHVLLPVLVDFTFNEEVRTRIRNMNIYRDFSRVGL